MTEYPQRASNSFSERMRLIRFRRKNENLHFWSEVKIVPRWLVWVVVVVFLAAQTTAAYVNLSGGLEPNFFPPGLQGRTILSSVGLALMVTLVWLFLASFVLLTGYVYRDAKRRGMSAGLWTFLVVVLWPAYFAIGYIIYFLLREPLPYACPQCQTVVGARFNYCPSCKRDLHPCCPQCKSEIVETDKFCPNCGQDLSATVGVPGGLPEVQRSS
jgi:hypothetical protein